MRISREPRRGNGRGRRKDNIGAGMLSSSRLALVLEVLKWGNEVFLQGSAQSVDTTASVVDHFLTLDLQVRHQDTQTAVLFRIPAKICA